MSKQRLTNDSKINDTKMLQTLQPSNWIAANCSKYSNRVNGTVIKESAMNEVTTVITGIKSNVSIEQNCRRCA